MTSTKCIMYPIMLCSDQNAVLTAAMILQVATDKPAPIFRSSVDVVRLATVVRDGHGRFVRNLKAGDFEVFDGGRMRPISDFRQEIAGTQRRAAVRRQRQHGGEVRPRA